MKIGFIGYGKSVNRYHLPFIANIKELEVVGYYKRPSKNEFEMLYDVGYDVKRFDSEEELYNNCDLVVISTPAKFHYEYAKNALLNNTNVLVEKPFCESLEDAKELFKLARENKCVISPYQNRRFDSDFLTIKHIINNYDLGEIMEIESNHTHYRPDRSADKGNKFDGSVFGHAVHFLDQIVSLYGQPDDVIYDITNQKGHFLDKANISDMPEDYYDIKLIYGEKRIRVRFSQLIVKEPPRWIINGTNATIEKYYIDQQERDLKQGIFLDDNNFGIDIKDSKATIYNKDNSTIKVDTIYKTYCEFYKELINSIENNKPTIVSEQEVLAVINIMETIVDNKKYKKLNF